MIHCIHLAVTHNVVAFEADCIVLNSSTSVCIVLLRCSCAIVAHILVETDTNSLYICRGINVVLFLINVCVIKFNDWPLLCCHYFGKYEDD